ncbi:MAG: NAD(P)-dependent oxidoreductase [Rickettsiales bacterium]|jgi:GDP-L-fucose synthase|nr:NAD(P)-dependent oxidoreductase [Rickettsiales bacterium]
MDLTFLRGKKILITGGNGFIGRNFVQTLINAGINLRITLHETPSSFLPGLVECVNSDLTVAGDCIRACKGIDYVIHAAGSVGNAGNIRSCLISAIVENLVITARVLEAASIHCEKILIFSSSTAGYPPYNYPVREEEMFTASPAPVYFGYGWMRRYFELFGEYVSSVSPLQVLVCRPTAIYGRYDNSGHVIPSLVTRALSGKAPLVVWGSGNEQRDFLHISDMIHGCLLLLQKGCTSDPVNIGYGKTDTIASVAKIIMKAVGRSESEIIFDDSKPTTIPLRAVDCSKANKMLGYSPKMSLEAGLNDVVDWFKVVLKTREY